MTQTHLSSAIIVSLIVYEIVVLGWNPVYYFLIHKMYVLKWHKQDKSEIKAVYSHKNVC